MKNAKTLNDSVCPDWTLHNNDVLANWENRFCDEDIVELIKALGKSNNATQDNGPCQIVYWNGVEVAYTWSQKASWENHNCP